MSSAPRIPAPTPATPTPATPTPAIPTRATPPRQRLSALVVKREADESLETCLTGLRREWSRAGGRAQDLQIVVVDASQVGVAAAIASAFEHSSADPKPDADDPDADDYIAWVTADVEFMPGSVSALLDWLELHPECGAAAPQAWLDADRCFHLPSLHPPDGRSELGHSLAQLSPRFARWRATASSRANLSAWRATEPFEVSMVSGACLFLTRGVAEDLVADEASRLLDGAYAAGFEFADLCRRLGTRGLSVVQHPGAPILQREARPAPAGTASGDSRTRFEVSRRAFRARHLGAIGGRLVAWAERFVASRPALRRGRAIHDFVSLGPCAEPPQVALGGDCPLLLELSSTALFERTFGAFPEPGSWRFPAEAWAWLPAGTYFLRALERDSLRFVGAWRFQKPTRRAACPAPARAPRRESAA